MVSRAVKLPARRVSDNNKKGGSSLAEGGDWRPPSASSGSKSDGRRVPPLPNGPPPPLPGAAGAMDKANALLPGGKVVLPAIEPSPKLAPRPPSGRSMSSMSAGKAGNSAATAPEAPSRPVSASRVIHRSNSASAAAPTKQASTKAARKGEAGKDGAKTFAKSFAVQIVTWNMNQSSPAGELPEALLRSTAAPVDIYVVSTQESGPLPTWERCVTEALVGPEAERTTEGDEGPDTFRLVAQETLWEIHTMVFARRSLRISNLRTGSVATGIGNVLGNKGGVGVGLTVGGNTRILFLNSHFAAHDEKVAERNADYSRIASEMFGATRGPGLDVTSEYDVTVWCGDFNYRVNSNRRAADVLIENKMWEVMRANDQLNAERSKGRCFKGFCEGDITFAPTFKFDNGTDTYDSSAKSRVPSWTDRVLWKCNPFTHSDSVNLKYYSNVPELKDSDHRPVVARLEVSLRAESSKSDGESSEIKSSACAVQ